MRAFRPSSTVLRAEEDRQALLAEVRQHNILRYANRVRAGLPLFVEDTDPNLYLLPGKVFLKP